MNLEAKPELDGKHKKKLQEYEDREEPQEQRHQIVTADSQDSTKSNSVPLLPVASCSDQGQDENASAAGAASGSRGKEKDAVEAAEGGGEGGVPPRRFWWGDCQPHVVLMREALLSSTPDIAVLGPLHGCFSFYMTHLHNEVLSSTYARTMTLGADVTRLESGLMWVGGWRPTSALVLIYSLMGIDIENAIEAVRAGHVGATSTSSLLSARQLAVMHNLQKHIQNAEMRITKKLTLLQMLIGDQDMLEAVLLDAASPVANDSSRFHQVANRRMSRFRRVLIQAEDLRLHTLKDLLSLLTPVQAARCGVAVFELCSALRIIGTTTLPILPALSRALPVTYPAIPAPSAVVGKTSVARSGEPVIPALTTSESVLSSSDVIHSPSDESLDNNFLHSSDVTPSHSGEPQVSVPLSFSNIYYEPIVSGTAPQDSILNSSVVILGQTDDSDPSSSSRTLNELLVSGTAPQDIILNPSDVLLGQTNDSDPSSSSRTVNALLVSGIAPFVSILNPSDVALSGSNEPLIFDAAAPSCTLNVSNDNQILVTSCSSNSSSSHLLLEDLKLDDETDRMVPAGDEDRPTDGQSRERIISNRLLLLSPASSDVTIQDCSLEAAEFGAYFEMLPQLPLVGSKVEESGLGESDTEGRYSHLHPEALDSELSGHNPSRMPAQCEYFQQESQSNDDS